MQTSPMRLWRTSLLIWTSPFGTAGKRSEQKSWPPRSHHTSGTNRLPPWRMSSAGNRVEKQKWKKIRNKMWKMVNEKLQNKNLPLKVFASECLKSLLWTLKTYVRSKTGPRLVVWKPWALQCCQGNSQKLCKHVNKHIRVVYNLTKTSFVSSSLYYYEYGRR